MENLLTHAWPVCRQNERRGIETPVEVRLGIQATQGSCKDIGLGGIGFTVPISLRAGDEVELGFRFPESTELLHVSAIVRWTDGQHHGAEFLKPTAELLKEVRAFVTAPPTPKARNKAKLGRTA